MYVWAVGVCMFGPTGKCLKKYFGAGIGTRYMAHIVESFVISPSFVLNIFDNLHKSLQSESGHYVSVCVPNFSFII